MSEQELFEKNLVLTTEFDRVPVGTSGDSRANPPQCTDCLAARRRPGIESEESRDSRSPAGTGSAGSVYTYSATGPCDLTAC